MIIEQQFGFWSLSQDKLAAFEAQIASIQKYGLNNKQQPERMRVENGVAVIPIQGVLLRSVPAIFSTFEIKATGYRDIEAEIRRANEDSKVKSILLDIDSPGGSVAGLYETAVAIANSPKPVTSQIKDYGADAAFVLAAMGRKITAGRLAVVGGVGIVTVFHDYSEAAQKQGLKVHCIRSGEHKGMGVPGVKITDAQIVGIRAVVDGMAKNLVNLIQQRRGLHPDALTGKLYTGQLAIKRGLVDALKN